jgi:hypothetical protein
MLRDLIEQQAFDDGVTLVSFPFETGPKAAYYRTEGSLAVAAISSNIKDPHDWNVQALHEVKHHETCVYDLAKVPRLVRQKYEALADRRMLRDCMPLCKIVEAFEHGACNLYDFAYYLEITEEFFKKGLLIYQQICGPSFACSGYIIFFDPFYISKENK